MTAEQSGDEPLRRKTHVEHDVAYAAVGASAAPDLLRFPPEGSTPYAEAQRLGSGADRFLTASSALMTWGAQRGAGIEVTEIEIGDGDEYAGVVFDGRGTPQPPATGDVQYGPDGEPYLTAGTTVTLRWSDRREPRRMRVVYTVDEPRRVGYAWGALADNRVVGEEVLIIEHRDDDTVWAVARGFVWPAEPGILGLKGKAAVRAAIDEVRSMLAALVPGILTEPDGAGPDGAADGADPDTTADDTTDASDVE